MAGARLPSEIVGELAIALSTVGVAGVTQECTEGADARVGAIGCAAFGTVAERHVAITATRDLDPEARSVDEALAGTSSVVLGADLTEP